MTTLPTNLCAVETIELLSGAQSPRPLFVLLHDAGGTALDMLELGNRLGDAFAQAAVLMPEGLTLASTDVPISAETLAQSVAALADFLRTQQQRFNVLQSDTALLGFGNGASLALALSNAHDGLVGRVLAFAGCYAVWPEKAPTLTTLHFLHGQQDLLVPVARVRQDFAHLMELGADATLDVARSLGHELHPALMDQAVTRLQTCVPLRFWKAL
ncbi:MULTISPECIES: esterase [unclassified Polaromonas]|uniref:esterase n=1 Tax=unclassified Polaromonas TaxID=2638319 RepID=UPI0018CB1F1E|nr:MULTISPECIES: esterase [unclassified Polaromonas]MBG6073507.1 phospholipase/carboxylesterase [Polaromonas sp. CG_9.7]MBG6115447.1 phospholipase/carboxylesterase [Polaromonas sp. CG_9.2]MDH6183257.1 phospholipase/carboxylesterase [Polaromonas sp. CG_23.6]